MKKVLTAAVLLAGGAVAPLAAEVIVDDVAVIRYDAERNGNYLDLGLTFGLDALHVATTQCVSLTPRIVGQSDSVSLRPITIYGRSQYYYYLRNYGQDNMRLGPDEMTLRAGDVPDTLDYRQLVAWQPWMDGARITLTRDDAGCCGKDLLHDYGEIGRYRDAFFPELIYVTPPADREKRRALEGRAYIDFPVDQTVIYPDYRRNAVELASIRDTIDVVRLDPDARIDSVWLKGYASPESPYAHNTDLAKGRTQALREYIERIYNFTDVVITTDYEPEDWDGLRRAVEGSNLKHRDAILALIDSDLAPDPKERKIKQSYPDDYRFMLQNYYPALRHTDYRISCVIRSYSDPAEIMRIMRTAPQKLDLHEFYIAASEFEPGTETYTEIFETAVRMYPTDPVANLNAANAAMRRGDHDAAARYLDKAGAAPEALYARAALAIRTGDYTAARRLLTQAREAGIPQAATILEELKKRFP